MKKSAQLRLLTISYKLLAISCLLYGCKSQKNATKSQAVSTNSVQTIDLPIFIPDSVLQKQLYQSLFAAGNGKYYPCTPPNCDPKFKDIYLEKPAINVKGNLIYIKIHVGGNVNLSLLSTNISQDVILTAKPKVQNDTLYFKDITLQQSSNNVLLNVASVFFKNTIEQKIQQYAWYSFRPLLNQITNEAKKQIPLKWNGAVLLLDLDAIHLKNMSFQPAPDEGVLVDFSADLKTKDSSFAR